MQSEKITIAMVHFGPEPPPLYAFDNLINLTKIAPKCKLKFITHASYRKEFEKKILQITLREQTNIDMPEFVAIEEIPKSEDSIKFEEISTLNRVFRGGFWFNASYRFFILADFIKKYELENVVHIENDVVLYFDPGEKLEEFKNFAEIAAPLDQKESIPSFVWIRNQFPLRKYLRLVLEKSGDGHDGNDMATLGKFIESNAGIANPLPTIPKLYSFDKNLNALRYNEGIDCFGGIFDAAAIGQYLGGIHKANDINDTSFFENEKSELKVREFNISWQYYNDFRFPVINYKNEFTRVLCIHAHNKDVMGFSPFNRAAILSEAEVITGERIQKIFGVTIGTKERIGKEIASNGDISAQVAVIPENPYLLGTPEGVALVALINKFKTKFIYTELVPYFNIHILPWLNVPFVICSHNSASQVSLDDLEMLNNPYLKAWFTQNCAFAHPKLKALPMGLPNKSWEPQQTKTIYEISKKIIKKTNLLYLPVKRGLRNINEDLLNVAVKLKATISMEGTYEEFLSVLACHKFILCPRGHELDSHFFWEAQYLNVIPIILKADWSPSYAGLPLVLIDSWNELLEAEFSKIYIKTTVRHYDFQSLYMKYHCEQIYKEIDRT